MVTICSFCGREIDEENEVNKDKKYLLCKCNNGFIPKGANSYKSKGGKINMEEEKTREKPKSKVIKELLEQGKTVDEIITETGFKKSYINIVKRSIRKE